MTVAALQAINTAVRARVLATLGVRTWTIDVDGVLCEYSAVREVRKILSDRQESACAS
jgi:hypothetical protein